MKRLILMRHAKSAWSERDTTDHERTLNPRGQENASAMGFWMEQNNLQPDHILCSDAIRTRETLQRLNIGDVPSTFLRKLYLAEPDVMATALQSRSEACVLMVAHNPGSSMLAEMLVAHVPEHQGFFKYPTCATLVVDFKIADWRDLQLGTGKTIHFITPRDITK